MPSYLLEILQSHLIVIPYTPPKPNKQQFAPENGWLQDVCNFLLETFYFQNLSLLSRRGCIIRSTRWWFQTFFEFSPRSLGNDPIWQTRIFFKICWQKNTKLHPLFRGRELPGPCFFFFSRLVVYQQNLAPMCDALRDIGVPCTLESLEFSWASVLMQQKGRDHEDNYPLEGN